MTLFLDIIDTIDNGTVKLANLTYRKMVKKCSLY